MTVQLPSLSHSQHGGVPGQLRLSAFAFIFVGASSDCDELAKAVVAHIITQAMINLMTALLSFA